jgi:hypothetical protein
MIRDVSAHMRLLSGQTALHGLARMLAEAIIEGQTCVDIAISDSRERAEELK